MGKSIKYQIGDKIHDWEIIDIDISEKNLKYKVRCKCGKTKYTDSSHLKRTSSCAICKGAEKSEMYVGKKFNKIFVVNNPVINGKRSLFVRCDCGKEYYMPPYQIKLVKSCIRCSKSFYPGLVIDGIEFIKRIKKIKWEMRCRCGAIFQRNARKYNGMMVDCGCSKNFKNLEFNKNKIGKKYKHLKIEKILRIEDGHYILGIKCICGKRFERMSGHEFKSESCGCKRTENIPKGELADRATLKNFEITSMREMYASKEYSIEDLSHIFKKPQNYILRIIKKHIWKHVN